MYIFAQYQKMKEGHDILVGFFMVYETFIKLLEDTALSGLGESKNLRVLLGNITCNLFNWMLFMVQLKTDAWHDSNIHEPEARSNWIHDQKPVNG